MLPNDRARVIAAAFAVMTGTIANAQETLWTAHGQPTKSGQDDAFGWAMTAIGDVDGDGVNDLVVGCPEENRTRPLRNDGAVYLISGATGVEIRSHVGNPRDRLGSSLCAVGDVDRDGLLDYAATGDGTVDVVTVWSAKTGAVLWSSAATGGDDWEGVVWSLPDFDQDGIDEVGVAALRLVSGVWEGRLVVLSGASGAFQFDYQSAVPLDITSAVNLGDLNGDAIGEFLIGMSQHPGSAEIVDGATLKVIQGFSPASNDSFGDAACATGDLDGDGVGDFAVADRNEGGSWPYTDGRVYVYSSMTFQELFQLNPTNPASSGFGILPALNDIDFNGDGMADILVGACGFSPLWLGVGVGYVFSGRNGRLLYEFVSDVPPGFADEGLGSACAAVDANGDGFGDMAFGAHLNPTIPKTGGVVHALAGNDLFLQPNQLEYLPGDAIDVFTRGGEPGELTLLAVVDISGTPTFVQVDLTTLDSFGEATLSDTAPSGLSGMTFTIEAYATRPGRGGLAVSSRVTVAFL